MTAFVGPFSRAACCAVILLVGTLSRDMPARGRTDALRAGPGVIDARAIPPTAEAIRIDGELTEATWQTATGVDEFVQREPAEGSAATHGSQVRVLFDRTALYIAVQADEPEQDKVVGLLTRRDEQSPSDWLSVLIDSYDDRRSAFEFGVNPTGVKYDTYWFNDNNNDRSWDAVWDVAVSRDARGWRAEFRIPFSQLRFKARSAEGVGFAVVRRIAHANETATWPLLARSASGYVSSFGRLQGLEIGGEQKRLELMPYVLSQATTAPVDGENPLVASPEASASVGLDLRYRVSAGLTLTGTVNPDFGQVEADPAVVNLGAFETFFEERRPFFVEGSGNFSFNNLFYSRRIGRAPQRSVKAPDGGYATQPSNSTVLGAAKLTGRMGSYSIGVLNAVTGAEHAIVAAGTPLARSTSPVEPATNYTVARVSREFSDKSRLSVMMTSTTRALRDELSFLPRSAFVGAVDGDWRLGADRYSLSGWWAGSSVRGAADAIDRIQRSNVHSFQRPDASHLDYDPARTSLLGHGGGVSFGKISGQKTRGNVNVSFRSPGMEVNDLGFQSRADEISQNAWFQIRSDRHGKHIRFKSVNFNQWSAFNYGGDRRQLGYNINSHWTFNSGWGFGSGFNWNVESFNDRLTRGGPGGLMPGMKSVWGYVDSDSRRAVALNIFTGYLNDREGSTAGDFNIGVTVRPNAALSLNPRVEINRNLSATQWIANIDAGDGTTRYVFGRINQTTVGVSLRANYTVRPTLTVQIYAQPFVSAGAYSSFKELVDGRAPRDADRFRPFAYAGNPNFNVLSFRTTNVLRWEYRPGSALFIVWQQGREDVHSQGDFRYGRDFPGMFDAPATNVFLVKVSRWFNY